MQKALAFTIAAFPEHESVIRAKWSEDDDFEELCVHFSWMSEAAETHAGTKQANEYRRQSEELRQELEMALHGYSNPNKAANGRKPWHLVIELLRRF